ncbi:MAG: POSSIBLE OXIDOREDUCTASE, partial [uncultured Thermomicrobiales bacterium]
EDWDGAADRGGRRGADGGLRRDAGDGAAGGGGRIRLRLGLRPPPLSLPGQADQGNLGGVDNPHCPGGGDRAGGTGNAGALHRVPQPRPAGQDGRRPRRGERRTPDPGHRCRLARAGVRRLRLPLRPPRQPLRGGDRDHPPLAADRRRGPAGNLLPGKGGREPAARSAPGRAADPGRDRRRADAAADRPLCRRLEHLLAGPADAARRAAGEAGGRLRRGRTGPGDDRGDRRRRRRLPGAGGGRAGPGSRPDGERGGDRGGVAGVRGAGGRPRDLCLRPEYPRVAGAAGGGADGVPGGRGV